MSLLLLSLKGCCIVHGFFIIIMLIVIIKLKVSHHSSVLCNIATTPIINNNIALLLLLSQENTFYGATSFDQPSLYCNWQRNNYFKTGSNVCTNGANCGWGVLTTCPFTNNPTSNPTEKPTVTPTTSPTKVPPSSPTAGTAFATCGGGKINKSSIAHLVAFKSKSDLRL